MKDKNQCFTTENENIRNCQILFVIQSILSMDLGIFRFLHFFKNEREWSFLSITEVYFHGSAIRKKVAAAIQLEFKYPLVELT
jgi:hypothetical protein